MTTPVFANSGSIQPAQGGEVACCSIAGGPFAAVDAYVSGGGGAQLEMRLYATVGTLRTLVATAPYSGPPVGAAGQGSVLEWTVIDQPKATNPVVAGGTQYDLVAFGSSGAGAPILCTLAGTNAYDAAVAQSAKVAAPSNFGSTTVVTNVGCAQLADVGVDQAGVQACAFDVLVSCGAGSVEALVGSGTIGGNNGKADVIRQLPLPVGTQYRLAVRNTDGGRGVGNVTASLGSYNDLSSSGAIVPFASTTTADDGQILVLQNQKPVWNPAPNVILDNINLENLPQGFTFLLVPEFQFGRTETVDASGVSRLTSLVALPPSVNPGNGLPITFKPDLTGSIGPQVAEGRYRGNDALIFDASKLTALHTAVTFIAAGVTQPFTLIAVVSNEDPQGVVFSTPDDNPFAFQCGNDGTGTYVCFDDGAGHRVTYPAMDLRGLSVLTWRGTLGTANPFVFRINGQAQATVGTAPNPTDGSFGGTIGDWVRAVHRGLTGNIQAIVLYPSVLTDADTLSAETLFAELFGVANFPGFVEDNGTVLIERADTPFGASYRGNSVETCADAIVGVWSAAGGVSSQPYVEVDGELYQSYDIASDGKVHAITVQLDGRLHTVTFRDSGQTFNDPATTVCATLREIRGSFNLVSNPVATTRISVYGNSVTQNFFSGFQLPGGSNGYLGWWQRMRIDPVFTGRISDVGSGGRSLFSDHAIDPTMATLAAELVSQAEEVVAGNRKTIWYGGIELNDWQQSQWSAADFGIALGNLVTQVLGKDSTVRMVLQSSVVALNQANPNTFGNTLADYRAQVQAVAAAHTDRVIFLDGLAADNGVAALTLADLQDDVHPSPLGHLHYYNWAKALPGLQYAYAVPLEGLIAWYEADQGVTPAGGNVSALANFGRNGDTNRNATNAAPATQPALPVADPNLNNQLALVFSEGGNGFLATGNWTNAVPNPCTIYFVGYAGAGNKFFFDTLVVDANRVALYSNAGVPTLRVNITDVATVGGVSATVPHLYCIVLDNAGTKIDIYVDDMTTPNVTDAALGSGNPDGFVLGNDNTHNFAELGGFGAMQIWDSAHSATQRATVAAQLKAKYGTP